ncbi:DUF4843 domain-containing protein [Pedobacter nototheniae]|uniref:DUF4843 domain-containing protein n=1 Tax=Pedobacter nototheniae TaxID=2488994 RepID=UPI00103AA8EE|nr:DUF4843 domain-containing protein [Pedobacter nototheniae]
MMKNIKIYLILFTGLILASCNKNKDYLFTDTLVEWDASAYNANASGLTYPILTRMPGYGRAAISTDPTITRSSGTVTFRVNLVGAQRSTDTNISYVVNSASTAIAGTHYVAPSGTFTIPANSSFGYVTITILNPGASTAGAKTLILDLTGNAEISPSANEKTLGFSIAQN